MALESENVGKRPASQDEPIDSARRYRRYQLDVRLQINFSRGGKPHSFRGRGSDVGGGGMSAFVPAELEVGQPVNLMLKLPYSSEELHLHAVVRNRSGFRYGLEFNATSERDRVLIERCCKALSLVQ
jgi:PilZ domain-containing protein